jgi:hypothetical protein
MKTYFCPRGCNVLDTNDAASECGVCGSAMRPDSNAFDDAHEQREMEEIARLEQESPTLSNVLVANGNGEPDGSNRLLRLYNSFVISIALISLGVILAEATR